MGLAAISPGHAESQFVIIALDVAAPQQIILGSLSRPATVDEITGNAMGGGDEGISALQCFASFERRGRISGKTVEFELAVQLCRVSGDHGPGRVKRDLEGRVFGLGEYPAHRQGRGCVDNIGRGARLRGVIACRGKRALLFKL
ncbi:hypothetical protein D3C79_735510 [compost metagenome]